MDLKILHKVLGNKLKHARKSAKLTQKELAQKIGITQRYIIKVEKGENINPTINVILDYLDACNVGWTDFFNELKRKIDKINYDQVINDIELSSATGLTLKQKHKIDRDISYYRMRISGKKGKAKPLSSQQKHRAAVKFGRYRLKIEPIEAEVQKILGELNVPIVLNQAYKDFARQCYSEFKKYYAKDPLILDQRLSKIMKYWKEQGLNENILEAVKKIIIKHFSP
jgi:transcriptional regulator with XRE-family HTH domain